MWAGKVSQCEFFLLEAKVSEKGQKCKTRAQMWNGLRQIIISVSVIVM